MELENPLRRDSIEENGGDIDEEEAKAVHGRGEGGYSPQTSDREGPGLRIVRRVRAAAHGLLSLAEAVLRAGRRSLSALPGQ